LRDGLFGSLLFVCAPIVIISSLMFWFAPLGLGFQDGVSQRMQNPFVVITYWTFFISAPCAVFGALPLSAAFATRPNTRRLGFQTLLGTTLVLQPAHFLFILWLTR